MTPPQLHPCEHCQRLFLPTRGGQKFCSKPHANSGNLAQRKAKQAALLAELDELRQLVKDHTNR